MTHWLKSLAMSKVHRFSSPPQEEYTAQLLKLDATDNELQELDEKELEAVFGGASSILGIYRPIHQDYGVVEPTFEI